MNTWDVVAKQSNYASTVGRQITFALTAVLWAILYNENSNMLNLQKNEMIFSSFIPIIGMLFSIIYMGIDLAQYYYSTMATRTLNNDYISVINEEEYEKKKNIINKDVYEKNINLINKNFEIEKFEIEKKSFKLFKAKFVTLPFILSLIIIYFIGQLLYHN